MSVYIVAAMSVAKEVIQFRYSRFWPNMNTYLLQGCGCRSYS